MDDVDLAILRSLIKNSRITISQMSKEIDIPDSTISNRLKKVETDVIKRYTLIPDWQKVGLEITSIIIIQLTKLLLDFFSVTVQFNHSMAFGDFLLCIV